MHQICHPGREGANSDAQTVDHCVLANTSIHTQHMNYPSVRYTSQVGDSMELVYTQCMG